MDHAVGPMVTRKLHSTYFDTPDLRLGGRHCSLRVRRIGRRRIQTLKTAPDPRQSFSARGEWENEIGGDEPDLAAFDPAAIEAAGLDPAGQLLPVFATVVSRKLLSIRWPVDGGDAAWIEVAFDRGHVEARGRQDAICELELELREGPPGVLLELASALRTLAPLRICRLEKAVRGYRLATGRPSGAIKAHSPSLAADATVESALATVLRHGLAQALDNEAIAASEGSVESIHQLRVALRRLRSALSLFREVIPAAARERWSGEARSLLVALGPCRDLDVLATELLPPIVEANPSPALAALAELAAERRGGALADLTAALRRQETGDFFLDLSSWVERRGWRADLAFEALAVLESPAEPFAARILDRRRRKLRKAGKGFASLGADGRHRVRINVKKLRYGLEFLADLLPHGRARRYIAALTELQDCLGRMNDIVIARRLVDALVAGMAGRDGNRLAAAEGGGQVVGWYARAALDLEPRVLEAWRAVKSRRYGRRQGG
jgi:inorganic triphosphatase YgiF